MTLVTRRIFESWDQWG
ncbi:hypothetical protein A2U01_0090241, partial [Trifolium medium]|nr:hypothetical protein [Trifolium medium]